jgi:NADPH:quinone reductase-like Zn-dependent oxidoreductase
MRAVVYENYGPPDSLSVQEISKPQVSDDTVLVRVHAAAVNPLDWHGLTGTPYVMRLQAGLMKPKKPSTLGVDVAGQVEAVGCNVKQFRAGDDVFGVSSGSFAEYVCVPEDSIVHKPANLTFEQAAAVPCAALSALQGLRNSGQLQEGQKVLINGAAGGVGTCAVQIAKALGAEVTGVCSTRNVEMVRSLGADRVIDYTRDDFAKGGQHYDVLLDNVGNRSFAVCRRSLKPNGVYVVVGGPKKGRVLGPVKRMVGAIAAFMFVSQKAAPFFAQPNKGDLTVLQGFLESGALVPVVDRCYALSEAGNALAYLEQGHAQGKIVILI